ERQPELADLLLAWQKDGGLEQLFVDCGAQTYIEARGPGAAFADAALLDEAGAAVARSLLLSPSELHAGLLGNLERGGRLVVDRGWKALGELRLPAMRLGVEHEEVRGLSADVLAVARAGLDRADACWLAYPE